LVIIALARSRASVQRDQTFQQHLKCQTDRHLLILLSLPRLIILFISEYMRSARQPWLHRIGSFLSFIPSMMTFVVFVLPADRVANRTPFWGTVPHFDLLYSKKICTPGVRVLYPIWAFSLYTIQ